MGDVELHRDAFYRQRFGKYDGARCGSVVGNRFGNGRRREHHELFSSGTRADGRITSEGAIGVHAVRFVVPVVIEAIVANDFFGAARTSDHSGGAARHSATGTHQSTARISFVDLTITIVVATIARFCLRLIVGGAHEDAKDTFLRTLGTRARLPCHACSAAAGIVLVRHAVAIVISPVANFSGLRDVWETIDDVVLTFQRSSGANAEEAGGTCRARSWNVIVDHAIAIVIEAVARFQAGHGHLYARQRAHGAVAHAGRAYPRNSGIACLVFFRK